MWACVCALFEIYYVHGRRLCVFFCLPLSSTSCVLFFFVSLSFKCVWKITKPRVREWHTTKTKYNHQFITSFSLVVSIPTECVRHACVDSRRLFTVFSPIYSSFNIVSFRLVTSLHAFYTQSSLSLKPRCTQFIEIEFTPAIAFTLAERWFFSVFLFWLGYFGRPGKFQNFSTNCRAYHSKGGRRQKKPNKKLKQNWNTIWFESCEGSASGRKWSLWP